MKESQFQYRLLKALKKHPGLRKAVIFKHSDRFNGGIPDISITLRRRITWLELKVAPNRCSKLQVYYARGLGLWVVTLLADGTVHFGTGKANPLPFKKAVDFIAGDCQG